MREYQQVITATIQICKPTISKTKELEEVSHLVNNLIDRSITTLADNRIIDFSIGGSYAKGTWVADDMSEPDLDIFVKFDPSVDKREFEDLGIKVGLSALSEYEPYLRYSEHPYVEAKIKDIRINVVPCYNVKEGNWKSAADRSPFHTTFMQEHLNDYMRDQVRILKRFLKSSGIYGSQLSVSGFSGYVTEILILKYGSFMNVIKYIATLEHERDFVALHDLESHLFRHFDSKIIIIDPIDTRRNLGIAISPQSLGKFILTARSFLEDPSLDYFRTTENSIDFAIIEKIRSNLLIVEFTIGHRSPDILWGQLKKSLNALSKQIEKAGFNALLNTCITDEKNHAVFVFLIEFMKLPPFTLRKGPEVFRKVDTRAFVSKNELVPYWINKNMKVLTISKRKNLDAKQFISEILSGGRIDASLNKEIMKDLRGGFDIYCGTDRELSASVISALGRVILNDGKIVSSKKK
jgi:tRNA nucleotidyltransferase (CCA-adding enzyme)